MRMEDDAPARLARAGDSLLEFGRGEGSPLPDRPEEEWAPFMARLGLASDEEARIFAEAARRRTNLFAECHAGGVRPPATLYRALAEVLDLRFSDRVDPASIFLREADSMAAIAGRLCLVEEEPGASPTYYVAPHAPDLEALRRFFLRYPQLADRMCIVPPATLRAALIARARPKLEAQACNGLFTAHPSLSARFASSSWQGFLLGVMIVIAAVLLFLHPVLTVLAMHLTASLAFIACGGLRLTAALCMTAAGTQLRFDPPGRADAPLYTVLVALRDEANVVPDLVSALGRLVWPRDRLEIKFVCEADDASTIAALESVAFRPAIEIVKVPPGEPRTKPKALAFALQLSRGDLVAIYDAEDRPHPLQLVEAWRSLEAGGPSLACVQAPLVVANGGASWIASLFALEYRALFGGLLPFLSRNGLPIPLGGTSCHFRRDALEEAGGWDPYNVTEDADLGMRLARLGYGVEMITLPTLEDGPEEFGIWLRQRTRWLKGWMQCWLVHMRSPYALWKYLGPLSFCVAQTLLAGVILSSLFHPVLLIVGLYLGLDLMLGPATLATGALFWIDVATVLLGYAGFLLLAWRSSGSRERRGFWRLALLTPVYWIMISIAGWRALVQLTRNPHHWEKTPHRPYRRAPSGSYSLPPSFAKSAGDSTMPASSSASMLSSRPS